MAPTQAQTLIDGVWYPWSADSGAPVTPPPSGITTLWGANCDGVQGENRSAAFTRINQAFGGIDVVRYWRSSDASPYTWPLDNSLGGYLPAIVSTSGVSPSTVLSGSLDSGYRSMFQNAPTDRPIWWCYWHEPEDEVISKGQFTVAQWQRATNHVAAIAKQYAPPNMKHCIIPMGDTAAPGGGWTGHDWHWWFDGLDWGLIDTYAPDIYTFAKDKNALAPGSMLNYNISVAKNYGKPWGMPEFGVPYAWTDTERAKYLTDAVSLIDADGTCEFVCYYESWRGSRGPWNIIDASPSAEAVWRSVCERN